MLGTDRATTWVSIVLTGERAKVVLAELLLQRDVVARLIAEEVEKGQRLKKDDFYRREWRRLTAEVERAQAVWLAITFPGDHTADGVYHDPFGTVR